MSQTTLFSPAKVNVALAVVGRLGGFHQLETTVQVVSLGDWISVECAGADRLVVERAILPVDNTLTRALELFRQQTGWLQPVEITLKKMIPMEAGLGGGSSNASTLLWALNQLSSSGLADSQLATWSAAVGSDCPLFFSSGAATVRGRGEQVESHGLPLVNEPFHIVKPPYGLSTAAVFGNLQVEEWSGRPVPDHNDLELPALRLAPQLAQLRALLLGSGFHTVRMTGSGSALLCFGPGHCHDLPPDHQHWTVQPLQRRAMEWY